MDEARAATKLFREVPLVGSAAAGRDQGKADLVFERGGEWRVVDFKTDRFEGADSLKEHGAQLTGYSSSLAGVVGAPVKPAIFLARKGEVAEPHRGRDVADGGARTDLRAPYRRSDPG
jgi:ATP-dependent exoDNAse (exonuclease V) beta subunit